MCVCDIGRKIVRRKKLENAMSWYLLWFKDNPVCRTYQSKKLKDYLNRTMLKMHVTALLQKYINTTSKKEKLTSPLPHFL